MRCLAAVVCFAVTTGGCATAASLPRGGAGAPAGEYVAYVVSESADQVARIRFGPQGARVERERRVGDRPVGLDGPHGVAVDPRGGYYYVTVGHGTPFGSLWKLSTERDEMVGRVTLGLFPASVDVTPDGEYAFVSNFNLHGDHVPSSISKVHLPTMQEVARTETCVMPHGSRVNPQGTRHYSTCMMDDLLVEIEVATGAVGRRFSLAPGQEEPSPAQRPPARQQAHGVHGAAPACSPTWAHPGPEGAFVYVTCNRTGEVLEIDARSWTLARRFSTGERPYNLEVTPDGRLLLVTLRNDSAPALEVIELASGRTLASVPTSTILPHGIAITPDSRFAFVSVEGRGAEPGRVDVIDLRSYARVATAEVGQQAAGIAVMK